MAGKATYEILSKNMALPAPSTIVNNIHDHKERITEGVLRCEELKVHLERSNYPKSVFLSEDASGVVQRVVFESRTNQLVGLVLPLSGESGMPQLLSFDPSSAEEIKRCVELNQLSKLVYIVVAQPLQINALPFILQIFGTTNRFKAMDVHKRWQFTRTELKKYGIEVVGHSSDGDSRLLRTMKDTTALDFVPHIDVLRQTIERIHNGSCAVVNCVQDNMHVGTKLRNRFLNPSIVLRMGNNTATTFHISMLIDAVDKEIHGLVSSDIYPQDRQNYKSLEKIMNKRVLDALKYHIPDSNATIMFLSLCEYITSSYENPGIQPTDRIYRLWFAVYFLRCWRLWIKSTTGCTISRNFITTNAYACIELNAQALIELLIKLRNQPSMFITEYFSSQRCEQFFRQMRSLGTANYTKINFTLFELFHMISRIELMNKIIFEHEEIISPRIKPKPQQTPSSTAASSNENLPSNEEILETVIRARNDAIDAAAGFDMHVTWEQITSCDLKNMMESTDDSDLDSDTEENEPENEPENETNLPSNPQNVKLSKNCVEVTDSDGSSKIMKKSTLLWSLRKFNDKLSADRLRRVQQSSNTEADPEMQSNKRFKSDDPKDEILNFFEVESLEIGDWAVFHTDTMPSTMPKTSKNNISDYIIGIVIGFQCIGNKLNENADEDTTLEKSRITKYSLQYASTSSQASNQTENKNIQALGIWYDCNEDKTLRPSRNIVNSAIDLKNYVTNMKTPISQMKEGGNLSYILPFEFSELRKKLGITQAVSDEN